MKTKIQIIAAKQEQEVRCVRADYAHETGVPAIVIEALQAAGVLPSPLVPFEMVSPLDIDFLDRYKKVYGCVDILRCGMAGLDQNKREDLVEKGSHEDWERWAIQKYVNFYATNKVPSEEQDIKLFNESVTEITRQVTDVYLKGAKDAKSASDLRLAMDRLRRIAKKTASRLVEKGIGGCYENKN